MPDVRPSGISEIIAQAHDVPHVREEVGGAVAVARVGRAEMNMGLGDIGVQTAPGLELEFQERCVLYARPFGLSNS